MRKKRTKSNLVIDHGAENALKDQRSSWLQNRGFLLFPWVFFFSSI